MSAASASGKAGTRSSNDDPMRHDSLRPRRLSVRPFVVTRIRRDPIGFFSELKRLQGDAASLRFGRRRLFLLSNPSDILRVLVTEAEHFPRGRLVKTWRRHLVREDPGVVLGPGIESEVHLRARRTLNPAFCRARVDGYWPEFVTKARQRATTWNTGESIDLVDEIGPLTTGLAAQAIFGEELGPPAQLLAKTHECLSLRAYAFSPIYRVLDSMRLFRNARGMHAYEMLLAMMQRGFRDRAAREFQDEDLLSQLLRFGEAEGLSRRELEREAVSYFLTMNFGGMGAICWALYYLASNRDATERIRQEVDQLKSQGALSPPREPSYLRAVVSEVLRLHPTFKLITRYARAERELAGQRVRPGDLVLICPYLVHRDERWWPDPEAFDPSRWMDAPRDEEPGLSYLPFGAGRRKCIGAHVASGAIAATIAGIVSTCDLVRVEGKVDPAANEPGGLRMRVQPRNRRYAAITSTV